jgi:hypothetical protein
LQPPFISEVLPLWAALEVWVLALVDLWPALKQALALPGLAQPARFQHWQRETLLALAAS